MQSNMRTYRGSLRNKYDCPKSVTTYWYIAATANTNEAVSRTLQERDADGGGTYWVRRGTYSRNATFFERNNVNILH